MDIFKSNPYRPPVAEVDASAPVGNWFSRRPIAVYVIAVFCTLQFLGVSLAVFDARSQLVELVNSGAMSPISFIGKLLYPTLLFAGGVALLLLKRAAVVFFVTYFAWGIAQIVAAPMEFMSYLSLSMVFGVVVYCLRLAKNGTLGQSKA